MNIEPTTSLKLSSGSITSFTLSNNPKLSNEGSIIEPETFDLKTIMDTKVKKLADFGLLK